MEMLARKLKMDPAELRLKNFVKKEQFPYPSPLGFIYDSGDYHMTLQKALDIDRLQSAAQRTSREARPRRADGHRHLDLHRSRRRGSEQALRHHGHQDVRQRRDPHPSDRLRHRARRNEIAGARTRDDVGADRRRRTGPRSANAPRRRGRHRHGALRFGNVRQPQHAGRRRGAGDGSAPRCARRRTRSPRIVLEAAEADVEWKDYKFQVKGVPGKSITMKEIAFAAYTNPVPGSEAGLEADLLLRSAQPDVPVRRLHRGRRRR